MNVPIAISNGPVLVTPPRRPDSVRRTSTHDCVRPEGLRAPIALTALGRDLRTDAAGGGSVMDQARLDATVDYFPGRIVSALRTTPADTRTDALLGAAAAGGFRKVLAQALPDLRGRVLFQLLDDVPTAVLVSGVAVHIRDGSHTSPAADLPDPEERQRVLAQRMDVCAGWAANGTLVAQRTAENSRAYVRPAAPSVELDGDPLAWHEAPRLPPRSVRRRRRLDVWLEPDSARVGVEAFLRDTYCDPNRTESDVGCESIVHEYTVRAEIELASHTFIQCEAGYGALPWPDCPGALGSAQRLVGMSLDELRDQIRMAFAGPSTCTHLNDTFRSLEDVPVLLAGLLPSAGL